jgi:ATP-dependent Zn protease
MFIKIIEDCVWPKSIVGWITAILLGIGSLFVISESIDFSCNFIKIYKWKEVDGKLKSMKIKEGKIHMIYAYKINEIEFTGDKVGIAQRKWHDVNDRQISDFKNIIQKSNYVVIKVDPKNNDNSVYAFNSKDIIYAIVVSFAPLMLFFFFFYCFCFKINVP